MSEESKVEVSIKLLLPLPPSVNHLYRVGKNGGLFKTKEGKNYVQEVEAYAIAQKHKGKVLTGNIGLTVGFYFKDKRRVDLDNRLKCLQDALAIVFGFDDSQIQELHAYKFIDKDQPHVEVELHGTIKREKE